MSHPDMRKKFSFYPGCSSQSGASSSNYLTSVNTMCDALNIELNPIPDWNCCSASLGQAGGGELARISLSARNIALSEKHLPGQEIVATCAACWLATRDASERISTNYRIKQNTDTVLQAANLELKNQTKIRHMVEVLIEDIGFNRIKEKVKKPLEGIKIAGYVGCQTNRPFGIQGESFENPLYLDNIVAAVGAEPIPTFEKKVSCCGGALAFSEPDKSLQLIQEILQSAADHQADMIATPCPLCQMNTEIYQKKINEKLGTQFNIPVVYYSTLMSVAFGYSAKDSALDGQIIKATQLENIAHQSQNKCQTTTNQLPNNKHHL